MLPINPIMGYVAVGALVIGATSGWVIRDWRCDAAYAEALEKANKQREKIEGKFHAISQAYEAKRDKADVVVAGKRETIREIYKTLPAVPADCTPDSRVVRLLEGSIHRANADASSEPSK